jgi:hypothetical protein
MSVNGRVSAPLVVNVRSLPCLAPRTSPAEPGQRRSFVWPPSCVAWPHTVYEETGGRKVSSTSGDRRAHTDQAPPLPVALDFDTFVVRNEQALYLYLCRVLASDEAARDIA